MAKNGAMVAYQGDVHFEHKGGGISRILKKAATGESLRLMQASGSGEVFLAHQAMLVHMLRLRGRLDHREREQHPRVRDRDRVGRHAREGRNRRHGRGRPVQHQPQRERPRGAGIRRRAGAARRRGSADLRRSPGGDRLVGRRDDEPQGRRPGEVADRPRLRREHPDRLQRPGLGARAAVRGAARSRRPDRADEGRATADAAATQLATRRSASIRKRSGTPGASSRRPTRDRARCIVPSV